MKELIEYIVKNLVDNPDGVDVKQIEHEKTLILEVRVSPPDVGKVIGRQGRTVNAIRTILSAAATRASKRAVLDVID